MSNSWLTRVLHESGLLKSATVSGFEVDEIAEGYTSSVYRLHLSYDRVEKGPPDSVIAKFHSDSNRIRETFEALAIYEKEVGFYQFATENGQLPVPACYAAEFDHPSGEFILLLEDLSAARTSSWDEDPIGDVRIALPELARIHARFWGDSQLQQFDWVVKPFEEPATNVHRSEWTHYLQRLQSGYRDQWSEETWLLCEHIQVHWRDIMQTMNHDSYTLVHSDAHLRQMFFPSAQLPRFVLFDWQNPCKALAAEDVAHLIINEMSPEERREHESELVELYYRSLVGQGVTDISLERFWFQCRLSLIWLLLMHFRMVGEPDMLEILKAEAEAEGDRWQDWVFAQLEPAILDWQLQEAVNQAITECRQAGY